MPIRSSRLRVVLAASVVVGATPLTAATPSVAYPEGYREWTHVKSMQILPGHPLYDAFGGVHHLYANRQAMAGYRSGRFPDGAVIVFDLLTAQDVDHAVTEGPRKVLGVMRKDAKRYAATGGWGFEAWKGGDAKRPLVGANAASACFGCHESQKVHGYVFSQFAR